MALIPPGSHHQQLPPQASAPVHVYSDKKEMSSGIEANDAVTGHIISTTIEGKNGEPKQTISYMAERVVGSGSFRIVFQLAGASPELFNRLIPEHARWQPGHV